MGSYEELQAERDRQVFRELDDYMKQFERPWWDVGVEANPGWAIIAVTLLVLLL